jgi:hypothetical protein
MVWMTWPHIMEVAMLVSSIPILAISPTHQLLLGLFSLRQALQDLEDLKDHREPKAKQALPGVPEWASTQPRLRFCVGTLQTPVFRLSQLAACPNLSPLMGPTYGWPITAATPLQGTMQLPGLSWRQPLPQAVYRSRLQRVQLHSLRSLCVLLCFSNIFSHCFPEHFFHFGSQTWRFLCLHRSNPHIIHIFKLREDHFNIRRVFHSLAD